MTISSTVPQGASPLSPDQHQRFFELAASLSPMQKVWLSGYLAGSAETGAPAGAAPAAAAEPATLTVLYGSQTGNARMLAKEIGDTALKQNIAARVLGMEDFKKIDFAEEPNVIVVCSVTGNGDPPENGECRSARPPRRPGDPASSFLCWYTGP